MKLILDHGRNWELAFLTTQENNTCWLQTTSADFQSCKESTQQCSASATIKTLLEIFTEYNFPQEIMTDNGPPFASVEFERFTRIFHITHNKSSPRYPQSNGFIERMVQTVKNTIMKCSQTGENLIVAILVSRAIPLSYNLPLPAELLHGHRYWALMPIWSKPQETINHHTVCETMMNKKMKEANSYNKTANILPPLHQGQHVNTKVNLKQNKWTPAIITRTPTAEQPRAHNVLTTDGSALTRNRWFIKPRIQKNTVPDLQQSGEVCTTSMPQQNVHASQQQQPSDMPYTSPAQSAASQLKRSSTSQNTWLKVFEYSKLHRQHLQWKTL